MEGARTRAIGNISASPLDKSATRGSAAVAGSAEPDDCRADAGDRTGGREVPASPDADDASWGRSSDGIGLCADYRKGRTISVRETDQCLSRTGANGGV